MHGTYQKFHPSEPSVPNTSRDRAAEGDTLIGVAHAAALLGVHPNTIRSWTDAGRLLAYRINARGDRRYRRGDVERLLVEGASAESDHAVAEPHDPQLAVLARLTQGTIGITSATAVCRVVVEALRAHLGVGRAAVYLSRADGAGDLALETHAGYRTAPAPTITLDSPLGVGERLLPLRAAGSDVGALLVTIDPTEARPVDHTFLEAVAASLAAHVRNARILARARRDLTRSRALRAVLQELTGQLELATVLEEVVTRTRTLFEADKAGLWLIANDEHPFREAAVHGLGTEFLASVRSVTWDADAIGVRALRERRPFVMHEAHTDKATGLLRDVYAVEGIQTVCLVPLIANDEAVGLLGLYHLGPRAWPSEEIALAQAFANQAAVAISNARLYRSVADQAARMRSIQDLSARLNRLTDVTAIAEAIVAEASSLAEYHDIRIYRVNWDERVCDPVAFTDRLLGEGDFRERLKVDIGPGSFTGMVAESAEPLLINDALADDRGLTIEGTDDVDESMLVVPMVYEGRAVGVIALSKLGLNQFTTDDLQTMTIFAGYAAQAIANAEAYARITAQSTELARQLDSQRRLLAINEQLLSTLDPSEVLESIADGLRSVVDYDNLSIYRVDHEQERLMPVLARERFAEEVMRHIVPFGLGLMGWVVDHAEAVLVNDALADPRAIQIPGTTPDPEAIIIVPLLANGAVIGTLNVGRIGDQEIYFTQTDFELVQLFAGQASIALRNAEAHHQVAVRADTDALTGLGNHGAFQRRLTEITDAALAAAEPSPVALLMMDLDNFKSYNDSLGHPAGDALLHAVSTAISGAARATDVVYRYGGDEFALILPGVPEATAATDRRASPSRRSAPHPRRGVAGHDLGRGRGPARRRVRPEWPALGGRYRSLLRKTGRGGSARARPGGAARDARPARHARRAGPRRTPQPRRYERRAARRACGPALGSGRYGWRDHSRHAPRRRALARWARRNDPRPCGPCRAPRGSRRHGARHAPGAGRERRTGGEAPRARGPRHRRAVADRLDAPGHGHHPLARPQRACAAPRAARCPGRGDRRCLRQPRHRSAPAPVAGRRAGRAPRDDRPRLEAGDPRRARAGRGRQRSPRCASASQRPGRAPTGSRAQPDRRHRVAMLESRLA